MTYLTDRAEEMVAEEGRTVTRRQRMAAAQEARMARIRGLSDAKALIRKFQVRSPEELLALLQCVEGAIERPTLDSRLRDTREQLSELCVDLDSQVNA